MGKSSYILLIVVAEAFFFINVLGCAPLSDAISYEIITDCSLAPFTHTCVFTKEESRAIAWPRKLENITVTGSGQKGKEVDSSCQTMLPRVCWPHFLQPEVNSATSTWRQVVYHRAVRCVTETCGLITVTDCSSCEDATNISGQGAMRTFVSHGSTGCQQRYRCNGNDCIPDSSGPYLTPNCDNACGNLGGSDFDGDSDGYSIQQGDCDDSNPDVHPNAFIGLSGTVGSCDDAFPLGLDKNCNDIDDFFELCTPVIIDVAGNGFDLTDGVNGVDFDLDRDGIRERLAWTAIGSDDAWLALDRDGSGSIDSGAELFGNYSPQPRSPEQNGFLALAEFDKTENGGNVDHRIDRRDSIYLSLRLWQDRNHNGVSEPDELSTLSQLGLASLDLDYKESRRRDQYGNWFRYRAKVRDTRGTDIGRWAYDVFLVRPWLPSPR